MLGFFVFYELGMLQNESKDSLPEFLLKNILG